MAKPINPEQELAGAGTLCEYCYELGNKNVPARYIVLDQWLCGRCAEGQTPLPKSPNARPKEPKRTRLSTGLSGSPPKGEVVKVSDLVDKRVSWGDEWMQFFKDLAALPDDTAMSFPAENEKDMHRLDTNFRRAARSFGIKVMIRRSLPEKKLFVAMRREGSLRLADIRSAVVLDGNGAMKWEATCV